MVFSTFIIFLAVAKKKFKKNFVFKLEQSLLDQKEQQSQREKADKEIERLEEIRKREQQRILEVVLVYIKYNIHFFLIKIKNTSFH
jgi:hypothetical protein